MLSEIRSTSKSNSNGSFEHMISTNDILRDAQLEGDVNMFLIVTDGKVTGTADNTAIWGHYGGRKCLDWIKGL